MHRLKTVIKEEVHMALNETEYKYGGLLDPKDFDPIDPEVHVVGYGTMTRSALRDEIARRLGGLFKTAKNAAGGGEQSYDKYNALASDLKNGGVLNQLVSAEIEIANQLENMRSQGGRRPIPIPKQY
jgi:hypothetical protein